MTDLGALDRASTKAGAAPATTALPEYGPVRHSEDDFMTRIQLALDLTPMELASKLGVDLAEVADRHGKRSDMSEFDFDLFWNALLEYVNERVAGLLAIKAELDRKARLDRRRRHERREAVRQR